MRRIKDHKLKRESIICGRSGDSTLEGETIFGFPDGSRVPNECSCLADLREEARMNHSRKRSYMILR